MTFLPASPVPNWVRLSGIALGTSYQITYLSGDRVSYDLEIALLFRKFCQSLSIFEPNSELSQFNRRGAFTFRAPYFYPILRESAQLVRLTNGAFDPTVGTLIEANGFGRAGRSAGLPSQATGNPTTIGFTHIWFDEERVERTHPEVQFNFNAIAKGYAVDIVAQFLMERGADQYLIELGGEVRCRGFNPQDQPWRIGIQSPTTDSELSVTTPLKNKALATSGMYRNCYKQNGIEYHHLIDPRTGQLVASDLLSVTVVADDCLTADALATAFMVMGAEKTRQFLAQNPQWQAHLITAPTCAV